MSRAVRLAVAAIPLLAACVGPPGGIDTAVDADAAVIAVSVHGDGFVELQGERVPLEAAVLTLRQRFRPLSVADRGRIVVELRPAPAEDTPASRARIARDFDRLLQQCQIMGVQHVRYL